MLDKNEMITIKCGTSVTEFYQTGVAEMEQELDGSGGIKIGDPVLVDWPSY